MEQVMEIYNDQVMLQEQQLVRKVQDFEDEILIVIKISDFDLNLLQSMEIWIIKSVENIDLVFDGKVLCSELEKRWEDFQFNNCDLILMIFEMQMKMKIKSIIHGNNL
ncbi:MAG: hypothetical protein EZS28_001345 [Streblomastix strix]|uniref:Uncharacterized protein n=1 Tax=Streblomastix strix TaxID=222440 RepID=A0A5J4X7A4_9EUKA|nr:MAG: hypothetical protein EZS28_001345 [Streblomastix strix]